METAEQTQLRLKKGLEKALIQFRANLIAQPLNENIKKYIKDYEDCLKKYHPDSELIKEPIKKPIKEPSNKNIKKKPIPSTIKNDGFKKKY